MIAVAVAVIAGVVAVTCGIVADSNHSDTLAFLGVMVKTTAAQIFLAGAICTWALFAALWLLSVGFRRSRQRTIELRAIRAGFRLAYDNAGSVDGAVDPGRDDPRVATSREISAPAPAVMPNIPNVNEPTLTDDAFADDFFSRCEQQRRRPGH